MIFDKFIKKKDLIHDEGVKQHGNYVDVIVISSCVLVIGLLCFLTIMSYATM